MRLAAAVRGLRMSGPDADGPVLTPEPLAGSGSPPVPAVPAGYGPVTTPLPSGPPELIIDVPPEGDPEYSPRVEALLDSLERIGLRDPTSPETARLARLTSAMVRLLLRKGVVNESELADAVLRAERGTLRR